MENRQQHGWIRIAAIAIGFALVFTLVLMLVPHDRAGGAANFVAILALLFTGIISPLSLFAPLAFAHTSRVPQAPVLVPSFQRPPPSQRG